MVTKPKGQCLCTNREGREYNAVATSQGMLTIPRATRTQDEARRVLPKAFGGSVCDPTVPPVTQTSSLQNGKGAHHPLNATDYFTM